MIEELTKFVEDFPGEANRMRCFLHIVNLVAKSLLKQFDIPAKNADAAISEAERELQEMTADLEMEELVAELEAGATQESKGNDNEADVVEVADVLDNEEEIATHRESIRPVRLALTKVRLMRLSMRHKTHLTDASLDTRTSV